MDSMNDLTEDRFTSAELDKCTEFGLSVGDYVLYRSEKCKVENVKPLRFSMLSDQHSAAEWWPASEAHAVGLYVIS